MAPLRVHQHSVEDVRITLPLEPRPLGSPRHIGAVPSLEHQPLGRGSDRRVGPQRRQSLPLIERDHRRQTQPRRGGRRHEGLEALSPVPQRLIAQVLARFGQQVVGHHRDRMAGQHFRIDRLPVQPLLEVREGGDLPVAHDQKLAVDHALEIQRLHQVGEGARDLVVGPRIDASDAVLHDQLHADAVPLPLRGEVGGVHGPQIGLVQRMSQHHRPERPGRAAGPLGPALDPGEQVAIGRRLVVPDLDHLLRRDRLQIVRPRHRHGLTRQLGGQPDPQRPRDELDERPAPARFQGVHPPLDQPGNLATAGGPQRLDDLRQLRFAVRPIVRVGRPDQRRRLGEVAHEIIGPAEQHRIDPGLDGLADHRGLGVPELQLAGQGRQRPTPVGVRRRAQIVAHQHQLGVSRRRQAETVQQLGEGAHVAITRELGGRANENAPTVSRRGALVPVTRGRFTGTGRR